MTVTDHAAALFFRAVARDRHPTPGCTASRTLRGYEKCFSSAKSPMASSALNPAFKPSHCSKSSTPRCRTCESGLGRVTLRKFCSTTCLSQNGAAGEAKDRAHATAVLDHSKIAGVEGRGDPRTVHIQVTEQEHRRIRVLFQEGEHCFKVRFVYSANMRGNCHNVSNSTMACALGCPASGESHITR
jgi:hypothetical protein